MKDQHEKIIGYRDLSAEEIQRMNNIKALGAAVGELMEELQKVPGVDQRWLSIAGTHLQQGFMAATRAIAQPTTF